MILRPFKGRQVDLTKPVQVYRNLNGDELHRWSVRQKGLVVAHSDCVGLKEVGFKVSVPGWLRYKKTKDRNVHAWVQGMLIEPDSDDVAYGKRIYYDLRTGAFREGIHDTLVTWAGSLVFVQALWARDLE